MCNTPQYGDTQYESTHILNPLTDKKGLYRQRIKCFYEVKEKTALIVCLSVSVWPTNRDYQFVGFAWDSVWNFFTKHPAGLSFIKIGSFKYFT
jgi:hypothetical protein